jgi:hypothetical protein
LDNRQIVLDSTWIARLQHQRQIDMVLKATLAEVNMKEVVPMVVIVEGEIKAGWDERGRYRQLF